MDVEGCLAAVAEAVEAGQDPLRVFGSCMGAGAGPDAAETRQLLAGLGALIQRVPLALGGRLAVCAGALVEDGADPAVFPRAVFEKLGEMLQALPGEPAPEAEASAEDSEEQDLPESYEDFELAAIACLSRSDRIRREQHALLWPKIHRYSERYGFLGKMLSMLDDERLFVVDVPTGRAWHVRIHGIADNFQLHSLLIGAFARPARRWPFRVGALTGIPGKPLEPAVLAAAAAGPPVEAPASSTWQLANWRALEEERQLETGHAHWIWNEGVPADIEPFEGTRVILIAPSTYPRSWTATRVFPSVEGSLRIEGQLGNAEAAALIARILAARRPSAG